MKLLVCTGPLYHVSGDRKLIMSSALPKQLGLKIAFQKRGIFKGRWKTDEVILKSKDRNKAVSDGSWQGNGFFNQFGCIP